MAESEVRTKVREALADPRYQRNLPQHEDKTASGSTRHRRRPTPAGQAGEGESADEVTLPVIGAGAMVTRVVFIVLLVVVGLLIAGWLLRVITDRRRRAVPGGAPGTAPAVAPASPIPELSLEDASRLAAEGRYAEAVHALLLAAIRHFAERSKNAVQPSRTSRELVRALPLTPEARGTVGELVRTVELSLFGGAPVGAEEYERSLDRFQALTRRMA